MDRVARHLSLEHDKVYTDSRSTNLYSQKYNSNFIYRNAIELV